MNPDKPKSDNQTLDLNPDNWILTQSSKFPFDDTSDNTFNMCFRFNSRLQLNHNQIILISDNCDKARSYLEDILTAKNQVLNLLKQMKPFNEKILTILSVPTKDCILNQE